MIVPVYQAELSHADNRGKLACIEFTGNIIGYASSVVSCYFSFFNLFVTRLLKLLYLRFNSG